MSAIILGWVIAIINAFIFHKYMPYKMEVKGKEIITEFIATPIFY